MYIITVKQAGLEFQYTQGQFKIPIISAYAKFLILAAANYLLNCCFCCKFYETDL